MLVPTEDEAVMSLYLHVNTKGDVRAIIPQPDGDATRVDFDDSTRGRIFNALSEMYLTDLGEDGLKIDRIAVISLIEIFRKRYPSD